MKYILFLSSIMLVNSFVLAGDNNKVLAAVTERTDAARADKRSGYDGKRKTVILKENSFPPENLEKIVENVQEEKHEKCKK